MVKPVFTESEWSDLARDFEEIAAKARINGGGGGDPVSRKVAEAIVLCRDRGEVAVGYSLALLSSLVASGWEDEALDVLGRLAHLSTRGSNIRRN